LENDYDGILFLFELKNIFCCYNTVNLQKILKANVFKYLLNYILNKLDDVCLFNKSFVWILKDLLRILIEKY